MTPQEKLDALWEDWDEFVVACAYAEGFEFSVEDGRLIYDCQQYEGPEREG